MAKRKGSGFPGPGSRMPIPTHHKRAAFVRLRAARDDISLYYHKNKADYFEGDGYTVWGISEWEGTFGRAGNVVAVTTRSDMVPGSQIVDVEGRIWEFFGYTIPLYDDDQK